MAPLAGIIKCEFDVPALVTPSDNEGITVKPCRTRVPFLTQSAFFISGLAVAELALAAVFAPKSLK